VIRAKLADTAGQRAGCPADIGGNGAVNGADLSVLFGAWGPCAPLITSVTPNPGLVGGATRITIRGSSFTGAASVTLGGVPATGVQVVRPTALSMTRSWSAPAPFHLQGVLVSPGRARTVARRRVAARCVVQRASRQRGRPKTAKRKARPSVSALRIGLAGFEPTTF